MDNIIVIDKPNRIKLTIAMRRQLKKEFGEMGYKRFLFANRIGLYGAIDFSDLFELDWFRQYLTVKL